MYYSSLTIQERKALAREMLPFLHERRPTHFVTANLNRSTDFVAAKKKLGAWHAGIDRALLGPKWSRKAVDERTFFVAFAEHPASNLHYHLMLTAPDPANHRTFEAVAEPIWQKLVPGGSMNVQELATNADVRRTASYASKDLWRPDLIENFVLSTEFSTN